MSEFSSRLPNIQELGLQLSSEQEFADAQAETIARSAYRRAYWQDYRKRVKRVFGTLSLEEYTQLQSRAGASGRSLWGQIWAESEAYQNHQTLATPQIAQQQLQLIQELRRIGNNINQLAKLGHLQQRKGIFDANMDQKIMAQLENLEAQVAHFVDKLA